MRTRQSDHSVGPLTGERLYLYSPPTLSLNCGQTNLHLNDDHCNVMAISIAFWIQHITNSSWQKEETYSMYTDLTNAWAKDISVRAEWLCQSGCAPSEPFETSRWGMTVCSPSRPHIVLYSTLRLLVHHSFLFCQSSVWNHHSGGCAIGDHTSGWVQLGRRSHQSWNVMGDTAKISHRIPSTCTQHAILSLLIIHIIPRCQIYAAIDKSLRVPSVSCHTIN